MAAAVSNAPCMVLYIAFRDSSLVVHDGGPLWELINFVWGTTLDLTVCTAAVCRTQHFDPGSLVTVDVMLAHSGTPCHTPVRYASLFLLSATRRPELSNWHFSGLFSQHCFQYVSLAGAAH
jgi:hypothetical protein